VKSRGRRAEQRASARGMTPPILLQLKPNVWFKAREDARKLGISLPVFVAAVLMKILAIDEEILNQDPDEIIRRVRNG